MTYLYTEPAYPNKVQTAPSTLNTSLLASDRYMRVDCLIFRGAPRTAGIDSLALGSELLSQLPNGLQTTFIVDTAPLSNTSRILSQWKRLCSRTTWR